MGVPNHIALFLSQLCLVCFFYLLLEEKGLDCFLVQVILSTYAGGLQ